jgi:hypothetical protein
MNILRKILIIISFPILTILFSCEETGGWVDCRECFPEEPLEALMEAKLTSFSSNNFATTLHVYEGTLETGNLLATYQTYQETFTFRLPVNKEYTITSSFFYQENYYTTVDAAYPRVKYDRSTCEEACYYVYDTKLNLKLKYR